MAPSPRVWFVTGASSGLGLSMTERALSQGHIVVATLRKPKILDDLAVKYGKEQLLILQLDVTRVDDITTAFLKAKEVFGRVDVVFNNARYLLMGEVETTPLELAHGQFNVNFWGALNVAREAVRFMREENRPSGGSILNISSRGSLLSPAAAGFYGSSKFALNGALEALSDELSPKWNITITLIELGEFRTNIFGSLVSAPIHPAYADSNMVSAQVRSYVDANVKMEHGDTNKATAQIYKLATTVEELPLHFPLGKDALKDAVKKANIYLDAVKKWESWSDDVELDEN